jgi:hypothetical protein
MMEKVGNEITIIPNVNPQEFGLQATEAAQVEAVFIPMIDKMKELESEFNEVTALPIEPTTCKRAKELRLKFVKIRTGTVEIHKKAKEYYRKGGLFVDAWKNAQAFTCQGKEGELEKIERHYEILEAERKQKLREERISLLSTVCDTPEMYPVSDMSDKAFEQLLSGLKLVKEQSEAAEKEAEKIRVEALRAEAVERERILVDNERLREEARLAEIERQKQEKKLADERARADVERKVAEEKLRKERDIAAAKAKKEREAHEAEIAKQKAEHERKRIAAEEELRQVRLEAQARADVERQKAESKRIEAEKKAAIEREDARKKQEELERKLADLIRCPGCGSEFSIAEVRGKQ